MKNKLTMIFVLLLCTGIGIKAQSQSGADTLLNDMSQDSLLYSDDILNSAGEEDLTTDFITPAIAYPPSNVAASMSVGAEHATNYFTGTTSIDIPLEVVSSGKIQVPISLNYSGTAVKVTQSAGTTGLSWSLSAGGVITKNVNGRPDEECYRSRGNEFNFPVWPDTGSSWVNNLTVCLKKTFADKYEFDFEPDLYNISLNGEGCQLFFDIDGNPYLSPYKPWKITGNDLQGYEVLTEDGTKYVFKTIENATYGSFGSDDSQSRFETKSAWFLTAVIASSSTDTISFEYDPIIYSDARGRDEISSAYFPGQHTCTGEFISDISDSHTTRFSARSYSSYLLKKIKAPGMTVGFRYDSDRTDVDLQVAETTGNPYRLNTVNVYDSKNATTPFKSVSFEYGYTGGTATISKRMVLEKIITSYGNRNLSKHEFEYYGGLPSRNSNAQDFWGYYNGVGTNTTLLLPYSDVYQSYPGANREPSETWVTAGMLKKITYPTGGTAEFQYESNDYSVVKNTLYEKDERRQVFNVLLSCNTNEITSSVGTCEREFVIPDIPENGKYDARDGKVFYEVTYMVGQPTSGGLVSTMESDAYVAIRDETGTTVWGASYNYRPTLKTVSVALQKNKTYRLIAYKGMDTDQAKVQIIYKDTVFNHNIPIRYIAKGGGARIKKIIRKDGMNPDNDIVEHFSYMKNETRSSGRLLQNLIFSDVQFKPLMCGLSPTLHTQIKKADLKKIVRYSSPVNSMIFSHGSPVVYDKVTITYEKNGIGNGKEEIFFSVFNDEGGESYPYAPTTSYEALRGHELKRCTYDNTGTKLKEIVRKFNFTENIASSNEKWITGAKFGVWKRGDRSGGCPQNPSEWNIMGDTYRIYQHCPLPTSVIEKSYHGNDSVTTDIKYTYDETILQVSKKEVKTSKIENYVVSYKYPNSLTGAVYNDMVDKNMIDGIVEQTKILNNSAVEKIIRNYAYFNNNKLIAPGLVQIQNGSNPAENRYSYQNYDLRGNPRYMVKDDFEKIVILWGYSNRYPIAEIKGVTYAEVTNKIPQTTLDAVAAKNEPSAADLQTINNLRTSLPDASVTTYTYKPLVGILTSIDPHNQRTTYIYDTFNRLQCVKDHNGKVIGGYEYHFQNQ